MPATIIGSHDGEIQTRGMFGDHRPPTSDHSKGQYSGLWHGTKRVLDPGAKRRANKRTWQRDQIAARKEHVAGRRTRRLIAAELAK